MEQLIKLIQKENLSQKESQEILQSIIRKEINDVQIAAILTALSMKGETPEEIVGFINAMRTNMIAVPIKNAIDVCGTGGDRKNTFNISTAVAFVVAAAGVKVAKHGNRAASSKSGSADVMEALGIKIDISPERANDIIEKTNLAFLFAPLYHPGMKQVALVRKELKIPTIFNILGPFANPARVKRQLIGVSNRQDLKKLTKVGKKLKYDNLILAASQDGLDEISIFAPTNIIQITNNTVEEYLFNPKSHDMFYSNEKGILGGNANENAEMIIKIFNGEKGAKRDIVLVNSAFALVVAGKSNTIEEGMLIAKKTIDTGIAKAMIELLRKETNKHE